MADDDKISARQLQYLKSRGIRSTVFPNEREVLLARMLLRVADEIGRHDEDQEWTDLYNQIKLIAEGAMRNGR